MARLATPDDWLEALLDRGSFAPMFATRRLADVEVSYGAEVVSGIGKIEGRPVAVYATDPSVGQGFVTSAGALKIRRLMDKAVDLGIPIVAFLASPGVSVAEGLKSGDAYTQVIAANIRISGVVPQIAMVMGVTMGAPAYSATLMDLAVLNRNRSHLMVTGPGVVERMLGVRTTLAELGGSELHSTTTGIAQFVEANAAAQIARLKQILAYLPSNRLEDARAAPVRLPDAPFPALPSRADVAFDMREVIDGLVDGSEALEVSAPIGLSMLTAFARIGGLPVGILANQSLHDSGAIGSTAARKAARFLRLCDAYNVPILTLIDVPGFLPGPTEESAGLLRHGAQLCSAMQTAVPRVSVVVRRCYGAAAFLMLQTRSQDGDVVMALEGSRIAVMGFDAARPIVYGESTEPEEVLRERYRLDYEHPKNAFREGLIDAIVEPAALRTELVAQLELLSRKRERAPVQRRHPIGP